MLKIAPDLRARARPCAGLASRRLGAIAPAAAAVAITLAGAAAAGSSCTGDGARNPSAGAPGDTVAGMARAALVDSAFDWDSVAGPRVTSYVQRGTYAGDHAARLATEADQALTHALAITGEKAVPWRLRVFFVSSRAEVRRITGLEVNGITLTSAHSVVLVANAGWRPFLKHEVMHAVSLSLWGDPSPGPWLSEGLAAAAEDRCAEYGNRAVAALMQAQGELIPLGPLFTDFRAHDDLAAYLEAGALVSFLLETHGRTAIRQLWDGASVPDALGESFAQLNADFVSWLQATPAGPRPASLQELRQRGCG